MGGEDLKNPWCIGGLGGGVKIMGFPFLLEALLCFIVSLF